MKSDNDAILQGRAMKMLVEFQNYLAGARSAAFEQARDARFLKVASALLGFKDEKGVRAWLGSPCSCGNCRGLKEGALRLDLLNSEFGFRHLMDELDKLRVSADSALFYSCARVRMGDLPPDLL